jgi:hypothetical protein
MHDHGCEFRQHREFDFSELSYEIDADKSRKIRGSKNKCRAAD